MVPVLAVSPLLSVNPFEANESDLRFKGSPWKVRRMAVGGYESRFALLALLRLRVSGVPPALDDVGPGLLLRGLRVRFCLTFRRRLSSRASSLMISSSSSLAEDGGLR